ncbi:actin [Acrasis kona]|uniref:Actin n=1 Tax=Acrasis kona TaxID=1008807 RepID=A0AAW2ZFM7_9EUKA
MPPPVRKAVVTPASPVASTVVEQSSGVTGPAIVIDLGSYETKVCFSDKIDQAQSFPTVVAYDKEKEVSEQEKQKGGKYDKPDFYVGKDALAKFKSGASKKSLIGKKAGSTPIYVLRYPYQRGLVLDWDQIEAILAHAFKLVGVQAPIQVPVVLTTSSSCPPHQREGLSQLILDLFKATHLYYDVPAAFVQYADNKNTKPSVVVDIGASTSSVTSVSTKDTVLSRSKKSQVVLATGQEITKYLSRLMSESGYVLDPTEAIKVASSAKSLCYVCQNLKEELVLFKKDSSQFDQELELPTGEKLKLNRECFLAPEVLFDPSLAGVYQQEAQGLAQLLCQVEPKEALSNVILCGGSSLLPGLADRVQQEVKDLLTKQGSANEAKQVNVTVLNPSNAEENDTLNILRGAAALAEANFKSPNNPSIPWQTQSSQVIKNLF